jgi:integrase
MHPSTYRKFYKSAVLQVEGVRLLTPHCCRHTYISHLEDSGADFAVIQALAGQSTQQATIAYIHPQSPAIASAVGSIEALLTGKKEVVGTPFAHTDGEHAEEK